MKMPSVTEVLSPYVDFSNVPSATLNYATERGIAVHKACAAHALGLWSPRLPLEWQGYVDSARRWFDTFVVKVILVETSLTDPDFGFTGTPDYILVLKDLIYPVVTDLKTPTAYYPVWSGQLAAYLRLAQSNEYEADRAMTLQPHPEGKTAKVKYLEDSNNALAAFLAALTAWRYFK